MLSFVILIFHNSRETLTKSQDLQIINCLQIKRYQFVEFHKAPYPIQK